VEIKSSDRSDEPRIGLTLAQVRQASIFGPIGGRMRFQDSLSLHRKSINMAFSGDSNVLLLGATGTGKSTLAREIHARSRRRERPFVTVNLACLHEGTLESELFGHERGAFTGADQRRVGKLELSQGGTVFLDEIGDLTPRLQARLLEFLQSRTISPLGSNREVKLDVRVIAATHRDLERKVREGTFREDLLHRLRVLTIRMPGISELSENFGEVVHGVLEVICAEQRKRINRLDPAFASKLEAYAWPGNFRELRNVLEYAVLSAPDDVLSVDDLPTWFHEAFLAMSGVNPSSASILGVAEFPMTLDFYESLARFEREYLKRALLRFGGRLNLTARRTGMNKTTLIRRLHQLGIHPAAAGRPEGAASGELAHLSMEIPG
jgi:two-component system response regulator AtoC